MTAVLRKVMARLTAAGTLDESHVHFHRGPAGAPAPCFDRACAKPRLDV
jgi:hypothetical protein